MPNKEKKYFLIIDNNVMKTFQNHIDISQYSRTKCLICWISTVSQIPPFFHRHWPLWWSDWKHSTWWPWEFCPHWRSQGYCLLGLEPEKWRIYYKLQSCRSTPLNKHIFSWDGKTATSPQWKTAGAHLVKTSIHVHELNKLLLDYWPHYSPQQKKISFLWPWPVMDDIGSRS